MDAKQIQAKFEKYVIPNYKRIPLVAVRGEGSWIWDSEGRKYLDLFPGWGVSGLGHCHPAVAEAVARQAKKLLHMANNYYNEEQCEFAELLSTRADGQQCFFSNSGAEANEGAIKMARLHCQPRYKLVTFESSFHGRTFGAVSATGQPAYHRGFTPIVPGFSYAKLNDLDSVLRLVDGETCAIMLEPVQGEGGVHPCRPEFLRELRRLCDERGMLLIFDEVQTTPARLGTWFGYQHFGVKPDILTSAKAIAGGMPVGLIMARPEVALSLKPGTHASTFGGNSVGCAAGVATIRAIEKENLLQNVKRLGGLIDEKTAFLRERIGGVKEARRVGFMVGIELEFAGEDLVADCRERGLLLNCTHGNVLRLLPAFNVTADELGQGFEILGDCLKRALAVREAVG